VNCFGHTLSTLNSKRFGCFIYSKEKHISNSKQIVDSERYAFNFFGVVTGKGVKMLREQTL